MVHMSKTTEEEFALDYDRHGDSYYDSTDVDDLKKLFDKIEPEVYLFCCYMQSHLALSAVLKYR